MSLRFLTPSSAGYTNRRSLSLASASSQYVDCGFPIPNNGANSISCWFKMTAGNNLDQNVMADEYRNGSDVVLDSSFSIELLTDGSGNGTAYGYYWGVASSVIYKGRSVPFTTGAWHHLVLTYNGTDTAVLYLDGSTTGTSAFQSGVWLGLNVSAKNIWIGACQRSTTNNKFYNGLVDNVSLYTTALTSGNVTTLYNSGHPGNIAATSFYGSGCSHWWPLGEFNDTTSTVYDRKAGVASATNGSPTFSATIP